MADWASVTMAELTGLGVIVTGIIAFSLQLSSMRKESSDGRARLYDKLGEVEKAMLPRPEAEQVFRRFDGTLDEQQRQIEELNRRCERRYGVRE